MEELLTSTSLDDFQCPICLNLLLEPVTTPCGHSSCRSCFSSSIHETSLNCPVCRKRLGIWSRQASKNNTLINSQLWNHIMKHFPAEVEERRQGREVIQARNRVAGDDDNGHIRNWYEEELKKQKEEEEKLVRKSEELAKKLQALEARELASETEDIEGPSHPVSGELSSSQDVIRLQTQIFEEIEARRKRELEDEKLAKELNDLWNTRTNRVLHKGDPEFYQLRGLNKADADGETENSSAADSDTMQKQKKKGIGVGAAPGATKRVAKQEKGGSHVATQQETQEASGSVPRRKRNSRDHRVIDAVEGRVGSSEHIVEKGLKTRKSLSIESRKVVGKNGVRSANRKAESSKANIVEKKAEKTNDRKKSLRGSKGLDSEKCDDTVSSVVRSRKRKAVASEPEGEPGVSREENPVVTSKKRKTTADPYEFVSDTQNVDARSESPDLRKRVGRSPKKNSTGVAESLKKKKDMLIKSELADGGESSVITAETMSVFKARDSKEKVAVPSGEEMKQRRVCDFRARGNILGLGKENRLTLPSDESVTSSPVLTQTRSISPEF